MSEYKILLGESLIYCGFWSQNWNLFEIFKSKLIFWNCGLFKMSERPPIREG